MGRFGAQRGIAALTLASDPAALSSSCLTRTICHVRASTKEEGFISQSGTIATAHGKVHASFRSAPDSLSFGDFELRPKVEKKENRQNPLQILAV